MRILFISDIHANLEALLAIEEEIKAVDKVICLGDILGYHCNVNEVIDFLKVNEITCIQGNHDRYVIEGLACQTKDINDAVRFGIEYAIRVISQQNLEWLKALPIFQGFIFDNILISCYHGSPFDPINGYVYSDSVLLNEMNAFTSNIIAIGHTHRALEHKLTESKYVINPGSVGQSRDNEGKVCALLFDTCEFRFAPIIKDYDFQKTIKHTLDCGALDFVYKHFQTLL